MNIDFESQAFEPTDMVADDMLFVDFVKVVDAQLAVRHFVSDDEIGTFQNAVAHRDCCSLLPFAAGKTSILRSQIGILGPSGSMPTFHQDRFQPFVAFGGSPIAALAPTFVVPRTNTPPRNRDVYATETDPSLPRFRRPYPVPSAYLPPVPCPAVQFPSQKGSTSPRFPLRTQ
ncbi:hypothetical protein HKBW3S06_00093 [Candidatus Hakubella thermalkaliphila]|uniref:Uncharacterized protein n=1 Tax=Candidatus Hakubella thermalkaliphila TaxID=2754717 RepID=A0A6V8NR34_9ACTN|nr:hypothetical protein HKBW3S06_00093 [Candidatus Hakubella thermalkaliphila]